MATHSSILAWKIPWTEEPGELYSPWGHKELDTTERPHFDFSLSCIGLGQNTGVDSLFLSNLRVKQIVQWPLEVLVDMHGVFIYPSVQ